MLNYAVIFIVFFCVCAYSPPIEFPEVFSRVLWSAVLCYLKRKSQRLVVFFHGMFEEKLRSHFEFVCSSYFCC